ncbi:MAG: preprotein translocase subunit YajC [Candidatus Improbicoccus pseudotrichonymphae]|uniref:Preprotein translocase subunit YajC n=1 Tax=Candidatus Improbicoccus pseudotrichonymphae TaxID=3033792 RepID=A0AA48I818_9FIRM|nr:MAG: preprotein translocase subunit YajC [Candidatus Improbicoccus pseudotrichonymphae]
MPNFLNFNSNNGFFSNSLMLFTSLLLFLWFIVSSSRRKKREEEMRKNLKIGDEVVTIGGIIGRIVSFREDNDSAVVESGSDKIRICRWAISKIDGTDNRKVNNNVT